MEPRGHFKPIPDRIDLPDQFEIADPLPGTLPRHHHGQRQNTPVIGLQTGGGLVSPMCFEQGGGDAGPLPRWWGVPVPDRTTVGVVQGELRIMMAPFQQIEKRLQPRPQTVPIPGQKRTAVTFIGGDGLQDVGHMAGAALFPGGKQRVGPLFHSLPGEPDRIRPQQGPGTGQRQQEQEEYHRNKLWSPNPDPGFKIIWG